MAKYLILIYGDEAQWDEASHDEQQRIGAGHAAFVARAGSGGTKILDSGELLSTATATSLRPRSPAGPTVTDGPFLETKEALGGYYVIDASDLDEAISLVGELREVSVAHSGVEIRPVRGPS